MKDAAQVETLEERRRVLLSPLWAKKGVQSPNTLCGYLVEKKVTLYERLMPPYGFPGGGSPANVCQYGSGKSVSTG